MVIRVEDAAGTLRREFDLEARSEGQEPVRVVGDASGEVWLRIVPRFYKEPAGRYAIHVEEIRAATDRDREAFEAHVLSTQAITLYLDGKFDDAVKAVGDTQTAEARYQRAIAIDDDRLGRENPLTAFARLKLGRLYTNTTDYAKAEPLVDEGLAVTERVLGKEHSRIPNLLIAVAAPSTSPSW